MQAQNAVRPAYISIISNEFHADKVSVCNLYIEITPERLSYAVYDTEQAEFTVLESHILDKIVNQYDFAAQLDAYFMANPRFLLPYATVKICFSTPKTTLVPTLLFDSYHARTYLDFTCKLEPEEDADHNKLNNVGICNVFAVPAVLKELLLMRFKTITETHHATVIINHFTTLFNGDKDKHLVLNFITDTFELYVFEGNKVLFYNSFKYQTPDDLMYYLRFSAEQLSLNLEPLNFTLVGDINESSAAYRTLAMYFKQTHFAKRNSTLRLSPEINQMPEHQFFSLLHVALCE